MGGTKHTEESKLELRDHGRPLPALSLYATSKTTYLQLCLFASSFQAASPLARRIQKNEALYFFVDIIFELLLFF